MRVVIVGAGVSGLSSAIRLQQAGHTVEIWTRDLPPETTSAVAAALWYPYSAAPAERILPWAAVTFRELARLSGVPGTGVTMCDGIEVFRHPVTDPWWASAVPGFRRARASELPAGFVDGYALRVPVADMSIYLGWLQREVVRAGGRLARRRLTTLAAAQATADIVVNCTGLGARELAGDRTLYGVRGQILVVDAPQVSRFIVDDERTTYVIPRATGVVMGGTGDEHVEEAVIDASVAASIRERGSRLVPDLAEAPKLADRVGIRPCRPSVRLERELIDGRPVVHNYGHGGSGVTLSWGCAEEVVGLVD